MWIPMFIWLIIGCTHMNAQQVQMTLYRGSLAYMNGGGCSLMNDQKIKNDPFWGCLIGCAKNVSCQSYSNTTSPESMCPYIMKSIDTTTTGKTTKKSSISTTTAKKTTIRQPLCEQDWQPSNRSKGLWCMQMISFSGAEMSRSAALSICKEKRAIISGLETQSDIDIVKKSTQRIFSSFQDQSKGWGVWIGGQRLNGSQSLNSMILISLEKDTITIKDH
uniref:C-type lectin domain-containing protein n=1 Tax=Caenorhabditis tropicalis TaxID=1561998 RepID=A0A1I7TYG0_9PELO